MIFKGFFSLMISATLVAGFTANCRASDENKKCEKKLVKADLATLKAIKKQIIEQIKQATGRNIQIGVGDVDGETGIRIYAATEEERLAGEKIIESLEVPATVIFTGVIEAYSPEPESSMSIMPRDVPMNVMDVFSKPSMPQAMTLNLYVLNLQDFKALKEKVSFPAYRSLKSTIIDDATSPFMMVLRGDSRILSQVFYGFKESFPGSIRMELVPEDPNHPVLLLSDAEANFRPTGALAPTVLEFDYSKVTGRAIMDLRSASSKTKYEFFVVLYSSLDDIVLKKLEDTGVQVRSKISTILTASGTRDQIALLVALPEVEHVEVTAVQFGPDVN